MTNNKDGLPSVSPTPSLMPQSVGVTDLAALQQAFEHLPSIAIDPALVPRFDTHAARALRDMQEVVAQFKVQLPDIQSAFRAFESHRELFAQASRMIAENVAAIQSITPRADQQFLSHDLLPLPAPPRTELRELRQEIADLRAENRELRLRVAKIDLRTERWEQGMPDANAATDEPPAD